MVWKEINAVRDKKGAINFINFTVESYNNKVYICRPVIFY